MNNNAILYRPDGTKRIADNTLVALTLMIAESKQRKRYNGKGGGKSYQPSQLTHFPITTYETFAYGEECIKK